MSCRDGVKRRARNDGGSFLSGHQPRQRPDQVAESVAADLEIAILVERGAGRREQHDRLRARRSRRIARRRRERLVERAGDLVGSSASRALRRTRPPPRRSDRPCGCAGKNFRSGSMPPVFGLPPAIQKMSLKQASACAAESALVALESLTKRTAPRRPTSSMRCASPGNDRKPAWIAAGSRPSASAAAAAQAAFCALCSPRSEPMPPISAIGSALPPWARMMRRPST